jgi:hypothetical protein
MSRTSIEGEEAEPGDFPASFFAALAENPDVPRCTATLIGPKAIATAGHCIGDGQLLTIVSSAIAYLGRCFHHPKYPSDASAGLALCALDEARHAPKPARAIKLQFHGD